MVCNREGMCMCHIVGLSFILFSRVETKEKGGELRFGRSGWWRWTKRVTGVVQRGGGAKKQPLRLKT